MIIVILILVIVSLVLTLGKKEEIIPENTVNETEENESWEYIGGEWSKSYFVECSSKIISNDNKRIKELNDEIAKKVAQIKTLVTKYENYCLT